METVLIIVTLALVIGIVAMYIRGKSPNETDQKMIFEYMESLRNEIRDSGTQQRKETQERLDKITERLSKGLEHSSNTMQKQFGQSAELIKQVTTKLTRLDETNKQVLNFSEKMESLESILKNPKQRGILGEYFLETLLGHVLQPNQYTMQYNMGKDDDSDKTLIVDAVIHYQDKIIPIDAKFSLEKYNKIMEESDKERREKLEKEFKMDVKNRIDETAKYIHPDKGTTDFSFMFIPAEGVYYNLLIYKVGTLDINANDLIEYAFKKHVIIVSPTSFFAYLQTVLQGLKASKMEESLKDILKNVGQLGKHLDSYETHMQKMGGHLSTTVNMYNSAYREFKKIDKDVYRITDKAQGGMVEPLLVDKPQLED